MEPNYAGSGRTCLRLIRGHGDASLPTRPGVQLGSSSSWRSRVPSTPMTPKQRDLLLALLLVPGDAEPIDPESVLNAFGMTDGVQLASQLVTEAVASRSAVDLELSLIATSAFGFPDDLNETFIGLLDADWHHSHEDLVRTVAQLNLPQAVPALRRTAVWVPGYLEFDDSRALARKAIHALGRIPGVEATSALEELADSEPPELAAVAQRQLKRRS